ncbi:MAG: hypothetical protein HGA22_11815, partial [Clostridiales bacterium]|nr:hypothetical protein [Clostridiales bacterium]
MKFKPVKKSKNKIFISWILSYLSILLIPVIVSMIMNYYSTRTINEEVSKAYNASMLNLQSVVDGKLESIEDVFYNLVLNKRVMAVVNAQADNADIFAMLKAQSDISSARIANNLISGIVIYLSNSNTVLSDTAIIGEDFFSYDSIKSLGLTKEEWDTIIKQTHNSEYMITSKTESTGDITKKLLFIQTIKGQTKNQFSTLIITLNLNNLKSILNDYHLLDQEYPCQLIGEGNKFISLNSSGTLPSSIDYNTLKSDTDNGTALIRLADTTVVHVKSRIGEFQYASAIPSGTFLQNVNKNRLILFIYLIACVMIGVFASYYMTRRNYNPIKKLLQDYVSNIGNSAGDESNAFNMLDVTLKNLSLEKENYIKVLEKQKNNLVSRFLSRLMKGTIRDPAAITELLNTYGIELISDDFIVVNFCVDEFDRDFLDIKKETDEEAFNLIFTVVENVFCELLDNRHKAYFSEVEGRITALINIDTGKLSSNEPGAIISDLEATLRTTRDFMMDQFALNVFIAISKPHNSILEIAPAYSETMEVIEFNSLVGGGKDIVAFDYGNYDGISYNYSLEKERAFSKYLHMEDFEKAKEILNEILQIEISGGNQSMQLVKCRTFGLVSSMLNKIDLIRTSVDVEFFERIDPINKLLNA